MNFGKLKVIEKNGKESMKFGTLSLKSKLSLSLFWYDLGTSWIGVINIFSIDLTLSSVDVDSQTMLVQTVNLPYYHHADEEALRDQERLERDESEDDMLVDDGVEERDDDEEYLQDDGEEEAEAEVSSLWSLSSP